MPGVFTAFDVGTAIGMLRVGFCQLHLRHGVAGMRCSRLCLQSWRKRNYHDEHRRKE